MLLILDFPLFCVFCIGAVAASWPLAHSDCSLRAFSITREEEKEEEAEGREGKCGRRQQRCELQCSHSQMITGPPITSVLTDAFFPSSSDATLSRLGLSLWYKLEEVSVWGWRYRIKRGERSKLQRGSDWTDTKYSNRKSSFSIYSRLKVGSYKNLVASILNSLHQRLDVISVPFQVVLKQLPSALSLNSDPGDMFTQRVPVFPLMLFYPLIKVSKQSLITLFLQSRSVRVFLPKLAEINECNSGVKLHLWDGWGVDTILVTLQNNQLLSTNHVRLTHVQQESWLPITAVNNSVMKPFFVSGRVKNQCQWLKRDSGALIT